MATNIPPDRLARVSSYDLLGSVMAMPAGALAAGPIAAAIGVSATQYGAAGLILVASALALIPREIRTTRQAVTLGGTLVGPAVTGPVVAGPAVPGPAVTGDVAAGELTQISRPVLSGSAELPRAAARDV
jgi:hypothetical protein